MRDGVVFGRLRPALGRSIYGPVAVWEPIGRELGRGRAFAMKLLLRFLGFLFAAGTIIFIAGIAAVAGLLWHYSKDLPDYSQLQNYDRR